MDYDRLHKSINESSGGGIHWQILYKDIGKKREKREMEGGKTGRWEGEKNEEIDREREKYDGIVIATNVHS